MMTTNDVVSPLMKVGRFTPKGEYVEGGGLTTFYINGFPLISFFDKTKNFPTDEELSEVQNERLVKVNRVITFISGKLNLGRTFFLKYENCNMRKTEFGHDLHWTVKDFASISGILGIFADKLNEKL